MSLNYVSKENICGRKRMLHSLRDYNDYYSGQINPDRKQSYDRVLQHYFFKILNL